VTDISQSFTLRWRQKSTGTDMEQNYVTVTLCLAGQRLSGGPYRQPRPFPLLRPNKRICYVMLCNVASNSNTVHAYCQPCSVRVAEKEQGGQWVRGVGTGEQSQRLLPQPLGRGSSAPPEVCRCDRLTVMIIDKWKSPAFVCFYFVAR